VYEPKRRDVSAAPFTDRIVHHAIVRQIEPLFERIFIFDSYACRKDKGTHAAVLRLQHFLRSAHDTYGEFYVLRADIQKFFASIDHDILLILLRKKIHDAKALKLCAQIIASYHETAPKVGQPIGNLTSQLFANIYLNHLDQYVKHTLKERSYLRYMDDFLLIHQSKRHLNFVKQSIETFVSQELALVLHPRKTLVHKFLQRERFVGYESELFVRRLSKPTVQRFTRRLKKIHTQKGESATQSSWAQFSAYASFAHAKGLLRDMIIVGNTDA
jgi:retron-type reverse transcriptase